LAQIRLTSLLEMPEVCSEGFDQVIDLAGGDSVLVGLHHHCIQRPVDPPAPLQQGREERSLPELRDGELDITGGSRHQAGPMAVAKATAPLASLIALCPITAVASASMRAWRIHSRLWRIWSVTSPALSAASSSDRS
jgi:hypothetical protein